MLNLAHEVASISPPQQSGQVLQIYRIPQITIHAFCGSAEMVGTLETAFADRRMSRAHCSVHRGGVAAAARHYQEAPTPNLIIIESHAENSLLYGELEALANVCDPNTKVVLLGYDNDVVLYRELLKRGVSEYIVAPTDPLSLITVVARLYQESGNKKLGRTIAFVGARGGVGSSTVAHNVASALARIHGSNVILADLDLPFGSAGLDFNIGNTQGIEQALDDPSRIDDVLLERLMIKKSNHLGILTAPAVLSYYHDLPETAFQRLIEVAQSTVPFVVLDVPRVWTSWTKDTLISADEVVITVTPDLTSLRNAKSLTDILKKARPHDGPPRLVLNEIGVPKRSEIKPQKFADALQIRPVTCLPFEPRAFSKAAIEGRMIADASARTSTRDSFEEIALAVSGRTKSDARGNSRFSIARLWRS
jgi:pilus assembly protein CpaE